MLTTQIRCLRLHRGWITPARSKIWIKLRDLRTWTPWQLCVPKLAEQSFLCISCLVAQMFTLLPQIKPAESQHCEAYFTSELQQGSCPRCCSAISMPALPRGTDSPSHRPGDSQLGKTWHLCTSVQWLQDLLPTLTDLKQGLELTLALWKYLVESRIQAET